MCRDDAWEADDHALESWARTRLMSNGDAIKNLAAYMNKLVTGEVAKPAAYKNRDFLTPRSEYFRSGFGPCTVKRSGSQSQSHRYT